MQKSNGPVAKAVRVLPNLVIDFLRIGQLNHVRVVLQAHLQQRPRQPDGRGRRHPLRTLRRLLLRPAHRVSGEPALLGDAVQASAAGPEGLVDCHRYLGPVGAAVCPEDLIFENPPKLVHYDRWEGPDPHPARGLGLGVGGHRRRPLGVGGGKPVLQHHSRPPDSVDFVVGGEIAGALVPEGLGGPYPHGPVRRGPDVARAEEVSCPGVQLVVRRLGVVRVHVGVR
mmetsp:Transcript_76349/g.174873  ORF Transcript_76349/g.174873 Transcript_76349/m.174873 type:complete len:226 (+) Transcript_76349:1175-1852(+)